MNPQSRWSLASTGNRVIYAVALAVVAYAASRSVVLFLIVGALVFGVATLIDRRQSQAGRDRQP